MASWTSYRYSPAAWDAPVRGRENVTFGAVAASVTAGETPVEDAVKAFFAEHGLTPTVRPGKGAKIYEAAGITILCGDVFAVTPEDTGPVDALYDRAALVALPPDMRKRYAAKVKSLLSPGAKGLLVTLEYKEGTVTPPPHSVVESEVRALYENVRPLYNEPATVLRHPDERDAAYALTF